eukprot:CAMPEP_0117015062 /NCGR_PEP_ID=MMETSP0472-20121206/12101_1 /TAXON_ID=693140 ORGANISM="Tiarina fusus, Strain LIS" /NCGR_SAMPLE_ID=MMETSP0472 /ASSEMBLY_ACC=CAM_ASM_000603 /LENGTH=363 /DNA_ID=CAMNT_0004718773 /DNA_START=87 /DNA_END=1178 /DNA_ORIENTATION=+
MPPRRPLEVTIRAIFCYRQTNGAISTAQQNGSGKKMEQLILMGHVFAVFQLIILLLDIIFVIGLITGGGGSASVIGGLLLAVAMVASFYFTRLGGKRVDDEGGIDWAPAFQKPEVFYKGMDKDEVDLIQVTFALVFTELCAFFLEDGAYIGVAFAGLVLESPSFLDRLNARLTWFKVFCAGLISILAFLVAVSKSCCAKCCNDDDDDDEEQGGSGSNQDDANTDSCCVKFWKYFFFMGFWCYVFTFWSFALASITSIAKDEETGGDGRLWWGYYGFYWPPGIYFGYVLWRHGRDTNNSNASIATGGSTRASTSIATGGKNSKGSVDSSKKQRSRIPGGGDESQGDPTQSREDGDDASSTTSGA